jgi:hypothetical protein
LLFLILKAAGKCFLINRKRIFMRNLLLLLISIPCSLKAQKSSPGGIYNTTSFQSPANTTADSSNRLVVAGANPAGIKISRNVARFEFPQQSLLSVYPNPAVSDARAVFSSNEYGLNYYFSLVSLEGRALFQKSGTTVKGTNVINFNMSAYPTGSYFLQLFVGNRKETAQFLKVQR